MDPKKDLWDGKYYQKHAKPQHASGVAALANYQFRGDEWILDIGCGDGKTSAKIAEQVPRGRVVGIDTSTSMLAVAKQAYGNIKNLEFHLQDAMVMHFEQKFDLVVSFFAMHWIKDQAAVLKNVYQVLKPGGRVIMRMSGGNQPEIDEVFKREPWKTLIKKQAWHGKTTQEYEQMLQELGFEIIEARTVWGTRVYPNFQALVDGLMIWVPHETGLPAKQAEQFAQELAQNMAKGQDNSGGPIKSSSPFAVIEAVHP
jgi:ubiquinone/menaquinone biosynthesis C-methylase UbiE